MRFATVLRASGIDAILDEWEVRYGDSFTDYMTQRISQADAVLFIMTTKSVASVESPTGQGGAIKFELQMAIARRTAGEEMRVIGIYREGNKAPAHLRDHRYADFRDDARFEDNIKYLVDDLLGRSGAPPLKQASLLPPMQSSVQGIFDGERLSRLETDTSDVGLAHHRRYFLQAWPTSSVEVQDMHTATGLRHLLPHPPEIRPSGFNLATNTTPAVIPGGGLRVITEGKNSLSLQRNGLLTCVLSAGSSFLVRKDSISPLALVESTLEFVRLFVLQVLLRCKPKPREYQIAGGMADLLENGEASTLSPGPSSGFTFAAKHEASSNFMSISPLQFQGEPCGAVAFAILRELYIQFGIDDSDIPYTQNGEVSEDLIRNP